VERQKGRFAIQQQPSVSSQVSNQGGPSSPVIVSGATTTGDSTAKSSASNTLDRPKPPQPQAQSTSVASGGGDIQQQVQAAQIQQQVVQQTQQGLAQTQPPTEYVRSTSRFTVSTEPSQASRTKGSVDDTASQSSGMIYTSWDNRNK
jgi:hypothetical protein